VHGARGRLVLAAPGKERISFLFVPEKNNNKKNQKVFEHQFFTE